MKKVNNRRLIGDDYSYSLLARQQNLKRFPALLTRQNSRARQRRLLRVVLLPAAQHQHIARWSDKAQRSCRSSTKCGEMWKSLPFSAFSPFAGLFIEHFGSVFTPQFVIDLEQEFRVRRHFILGAYHLAGVAKNSPTTAITPLFALKTSGQKDLSLLQTTHRGLSVKKGCVRRKRRNM